MIIFSSNDEKTKLYKIVTGTTSQLGMREPQMYATH